jgi:hypothetical protein
MTKRRLIKKRGGELKNINVDNFREYMDKPLTPESKTSTSEERQSQRVSEYTMNKDKNLESEYKRLAKQVALEESEVKDRQKAEREKEKKQMRPYFDELGKQEKHRVYYDELSKQDKKDQINNFWDSLKQKNLPFPDLNYYENVLDCNSKKKNYFSLFDDKEQKVCRKIQKLKGKPTRKTTQQPQQPTNRSFYSRLFTKQNRSRMGGKKYNTRRNRQRNTQKKR